jgi:hypothetical protein
MLELPLYERKRERERERESGGVVFKLFIYLLNLH